MQRFFFILQDETLSTGDQSRRFLPQYRFAEFTQAVREAERLSQKHVGKRFFVLSAVAAVETDNDGQRWSELLGENPVVPTRAGTVD